jgi:hypothetical protein
VEIANCGFPAPLSLGTPYFGVGPLQHRAILLYRLEVQPQAEGRSTIGANVGKLFCMFDQRGSFFWLLAKPVDENRKSVAARKKM